MPYIHDEKCAALTVIPCVMNMERELGRTSIRSDCPMSFIVISFRTETFLKPANATSNPPAPTNREMGHYKETQFPDTKLYITITLLQKRNKVIPVTGRTGL
jgi:hypothetical protein